MTFATSAGRTLTKRDDLDSLRGDLTCRTCHQETSKATDEWREFKCVVTGEDMDYDWGPCGSYMCGDGAIPFAAAKEPEQTMIHVAFDEARAEIKRLKQLNKALVHGQDVLAAELEKRHSWSYEEMDALQKEIERLRAQLADILIEMDGTAENVVAFTTKKIDVAEFRRRVISRIYYIAKRLVEASRKGVAPPAAYFSCPYCPVEGITTKGEYEKHLATHEKPAAPDPCITCTNCRICWPSAPIPAGGLVGQYIIKELARADPVSRETPAEVK